MYQTHFIERLYSHFQRSEKKLNQNNPLILKEWEKLSDTEKKQLSVDFFEKGKKKLENNDINGIQHFEASCFLDPTNAENCLKQGKALLTYGKKNKDKKVLLQANQNFSMAIKLFSEMLHSWWYFGLSLQALGDLLEEEHYYLQAKEKFQQAITLSENQPKSILAKLYWDFAICLHNIANHSGEAIDVRKALQAMKTSLSHQTHSPQEFWYDYGNIFVQMGLLINEKNTFMQAIEYFQKTIAIDAAYAQGWVALAQTYTQVYINTLDEKCFQQAHNSFIKAVHLLPNEGSLFLEWAQLLGESGKINKDSTKLRESMDKCQLAQKNDRNNPLVLGQWVEAQSMLGAFTNRVDLIIEAENKIIDFTDQYSDEPELWYAYGLCMQAYSTYYNDLDYEEIAIEKFQTGLSLDRSNAELWLALASSFSKIGIETEDLEVLEKACKYYHQANHLKPSCAYLIFDYAKTLYFFGKINEKQSDLEKSIELFEMILHNQNEVLLQHPEWLFYYGCALDQLGDTYDHEEENCYAKSIEVLHNVLLIEPDYPRIHFQLALSYSHLAEITLNTEFFQKAITFFQLATKQNEEDDEVWLEWGITLISLARVLEEPFTLDQLYVEAEQKLLRSGQLGNQQVYYHLACLYSLISKFDKAFTLLKQAKELDVLPSIEEILQDDWLENIQSTPLFSQFIAELEKSK